MDHLTRKPFSLTIRIPGLLAAEKTLFGVNAAGDATYFFSYTNYIN